MKLQVGTSTINSSSWVQPFKSIMAEERKKQYRDTRHNMQFLSTSREMLTSRDIGNVWHNAGKQSGLAVTTVHRMIEVPQLTCGCVSGGAFSGHFRDIAEQTDGIEPSLLLSSVSHRNRS